MAKFRRRRSFVRSCCVVALLAASSLPATALTCMPDLMRLSRGNAVLVKVTPLLVPYLYDVQLVQVIRGNVKGRRSGLGASDGWFQPRSQLGLQIVGWSESFWGSGTYLSGCSPRMGSLTLPEAVAAAREVDSILAGHDVVDFDEFDPEAVAPLLFMLKDGDRLLAMREAMVARDRSLRNLIALAEVHIGLFDMERAEAMIPEISGYDPASGDAIRALIDAEMERSSSWF